LELGGNSGNVWDNDGIYVGWVDCGILWMSMVWS